MEDYTLDIDVAGGKYTVRQEIQGKLYALRYGSEWRDLTGDGLVLNMAYELEASKEKIITLESRILKMIHANRQRQISMTLEEVDKIIEEGGVEGC